MQFLRGHFALLLGLLLIQRPDDTDIFDVLPGTGRQDKLNNLISQIHQFAGLYATLGDWIHCAGDNGHYSSDSGITLSCLIPDHIGCGEVTTQLNTSLATLRDKYL